MMLTKTDISPMLITTDQTLKANAGFHYILEKAQEVYNTLEKTAKSEYMVKKVEGDTCISGKAEGVCCVSIDTAVPQRLYL